MSCVLGIDLSSHAIDLVKLNESDDRAAWTRAKLHGANAWERTLHVPDVMPTGSWYDDVYLIAIERPFYVRDDSIRLIQGAALACLPIRLRQPFTLWEAHPSTWKAACKIKKKPTFDDVHRLAPDGGIDAPDTTTAEEWQNGLDAYCIAWWARQENVRVNASANEAA